MWYSTKSMVQLVVAALLLVLSTGCGEDQCLAACGSFEGIHVRFILGVDSTYDAELVLDGVPGAFTCELDSETPRWSLVDSTGNVPVATCRELGFDIEASPVSVAISVSAEDGWVASTEEDPNYVRGSICGNLCPPAADVTLPTSACANPSDAAKVAEASFESEAYDACVERESYDAKPVAACLEEEPPGLSPACAACYGQFTGCSSNCIEPCVVTPMAGACQSCLDRVQCVPEFEACSGLEEPFPGSGQ